MTETDRRLTQRREENDMQCCEATSRNRTADLLITKSECVRPDDADGFAHPVEAERTFAGREAGDA